MATIGRTVAYKLEIDWNFNLTYTDESAYLIRASGDYRIAAPGSSILSPRGIIPQMNITLFNDGRFSPFNSSGALYSDIQGSKAYHAAVKFSVSIDGGAYVVVFTGHLKTPVESGVTYDGTPTVTFDCRGVEERLQHRRISTTLADFAGYFDDGKTEGELITAWLTAAGMTPGAGEIDRGLVVIPAAWMDDESPLEDIWQLAAACGGWAYSTRAGRMVYRNATYLASGAAATETIDSDGFQRLSLRYDDKELYSEIIVEASPRELQQDGVLWEPDELPVIASDATETITATLRQPAYMVTALAFDAVTYGGVDISADVSVVQTEYAQRIELAITNANTTYAAVLRNMQIIGLGISGGPTIEEKAVAVNAGGFWNAAYYRDQRSRTLRGNVYIQSRRQASMLAAMLRDWHESPRVYASVSGVQGVPDRDLLDRITISDTNVMSSDLDIFITSIRWTADSTGFKQDIEGIAADGFFPYADDAEGYFIIGTNKPGASGGSLTARLFY